MNKQFSILLLLLLLTLPGWGQKSVAVSATVSPIVSNTYYNYRYFYPESDGQIVEPVYLNGSRWLSGYCAGLSILYNYAPGWSVSSGVWFEQISIQQNRQPAAGLGVITLHNRVIRVPVYLNYYSSAKRLSPYFSLGFLVDLPITSRMVVQRDGESTQHLRLTASLKPIFHLTIGAGVRYKLTKRYTLMAQPTWSYKLGQFGGSSTNDSSFELGFLTQFGYTF